MHSRMALATWKVLIGFVQSGTPQWSPSLFLAVLASSNCLGALERWDLVLVNGTPNVGFISKPTLFSSLTWVSLFSQRDFSFYYRRFSLYIKMIALEPSFFICFFSTTVTFSSSNLYPINTHRKHLMQSLNESHLQYVFSSFLRGWKQSPLTKVMYFPDSANSPSCVTTAILKISPLLGGLERSQIHYHIIHTTHLY